MGVSSPFLPFFLFSELCAFLKLERSDSRKRARNSVPAPLPGVHYLPSFSFFVGENLAQNFSSLLLLPDEAV